MYLSVNKVAFVVIISESAIVAPASQFITMLVMNQNCICPSLRVGIVDIELCVLSLRESAHSAVSQESTEKNEIYSVVAKSREMETYIQQYRPITVSCVFKIAQHPLLRGASNERKITITIPL